MPARFRILPVHRPAGAGGSAGAAGPLVAREVEVVDAGVVRLGRRADLELPLPFPALSAVHAQVRREGGGWTVEDAGSTNGTWLGDERLPAGERRALAPGTELRLGNVRLRFEGDGTPAGAVEGTGTIARRLVDDLFGASTGAAPSLRIVRGAPPGQLTLADPGRVYVVGRSEGCALPLSVEEVSREHAALERNAAGVLLRDLGSKNGVSVGGARVAGERRLADGDQVQIGPVTLAFDDPAERYLRQLDDAAPDVEIVEAPPAWPPEEAPAAPAPDDSPPPPRGTSRLALVVGVSVLLLLAAVVAAVVAQ
jgi:pSer/pThr/pTyr-binding forkhead associated (FHA) protein